MILSAAFSPCPNDIFLFFGFLSALEGFPLLKQIRIADIAKLNTFALENRYPLIKVSAALFPKVSKHYDLLPVGNILGRRVGPLIVASEPECSPTMIATPGETTTAHLLCRIFYPRALCKPMLYHEIIPTVLCRKIPAGVIIHEERFSYSSQLHLIEDLGVLWEKTTNLPLPLGCLLLAKSHANEIDPLTTLIRQSLVAALSHRELAEQKASEYARDPSKIQSFIATYINEETLTLSKEGYAALEALWSYHV